MPLILFMLFVLVPVAELFVIIQVGQAIGVLPTIGLMVLSAIAGATMLRSQGRQAWRNFNEAMASRRIPAREVFDGALIMFGGALLLTPGFLTDILGLFLLLPPGRAMIRRISRGAAARTPSGRPVFFVYDRIPGTGRRSGGPSAAGDPAGSAGPRPGAGPAGAGQPPRRPTSRAYDVEGSAREIDDSEYELPDATESGADEQAGGERDG